VQRKDTESQKRKKKETKESFVKVNRFELGLGSLSEGQNEK